MNSTDLATIGFVSWMLFIRSSGKQLLRAAPTAEGVYVIRRRLLFQRVRRTSDILYIGSAMNRSGGLQRRCRQDFHPGHGNATSKRLLALCGNCDDYEIAFLT